MPIKEALPFIRLIHVTTLERLEHRISLAHLPDPSLLNYDEDFFFNDKSSVIVLAALVYRPYEILTLKMQVKGVGRPTSFTLKSSGCLPFAQRKPKKRCSDVAT
jgi:hypothetical protein